MRKTASTPDGKPENKSRPGSKPVPKTPKELAGDMAGRGAYDRAKVRRASQQAVKSADRLLKDMDDVFRRLERKR